MLPLLQLFILLPLFAFLLSLIFNKKKERIISTLAIGTTIIYLTGIIAFIGYWLWHGYPVLDSQHAVLYRSPAFDFIINFYFDKTTAVFSFTGGLITMLVAIFSRFYMHRDEGFKRFFNTLLLFFTGYNLVIFSGNFETLFIGWEVLGICSFLLIAFYRDRYLPVKNGMKVLSIYRLGDVCLLLAMWMCHHLFHENITFLELTTPGFMNSVITEHKLLVTFSAVMIIIAAAAKSALLPFSSWLPRAMEGPTTSSAIFYGSLSIHLGGFLLIRTYPLWEALLSVKIMIITLGCITAIVAASIARVQSTVKTQIAYASITQIGLIFIEIALGFHTLALIHFAGNAFLRTYQLLVSPSVLGYRIHDMFFSFKPAASAQRSPVAQKINNAFYILNLKEWNLDTFMHNFLWAPFKKTGTHMNRFMKRVSLSLISVIFIFSLFSFSTKEKVPAHLDEILPIAFSAIGLLLVLAGFSERGDARRAWFLILGGQGFITLSISANAHVPLHQVIMYLSGVAAAALVGFVCLTKIKNAGNSITLDSFHGLTYDRPWAGFIFLICCLALAGFPFTPTFLGIDLLFTHLGKDQIVLTALTALSFIFIELAVIRLYARIFLGQHKRNDHPIAFRSS